MRTFNAQAARGFRLGGINDPINMPLCSPQDLQVFGHSGNWKDEKDLGLRARREVAVVGSARHLQCHGVLYRHQGPAGDDHGRHLFLAYRVQRADGAQHRRRGGAVRATDRELGLRNVGDGPRCQADLFGDFDHRPAGSCRHTVDGGGRGGLADGNRLPTAPKIQAVGSVGYTLPLQNATDFFANFTVQYVGSSFSQFENEEPGWGQIGGTGDPNAARLIAYGGPLTVSQINFASELPSYTLANLRFGVKTDRWQAAAYINNISDKSAALALDYERGRSARVGYLTNQPRTIGVYGSYNW